MIELTAAFVVGWMLRPLWECFLKPILKVAIEAALEAKDGKCKHCTDGCPACDARKLSKEAHDLL
jgi:hypothetical protein